MDAMFFHLVLPYVTRARPHVPWPSTGDEMIFLAGQETAP
jgi:hypothetical protein